MNQTNGSNIEVIELHRRAEIKSIISRELEKAICQFWILNHA